ncbi:hypothetical protein NDU88_006815 [Pleurodeles waltl]|uniref:Uncharacterized protein n=1 Tax=Pleurodeles waltl TaxID=8319 RepID=A0AAV7RQ11_PLEWA|nr:hypothetical protein NDU88_006815 [Pleurodeles waltl]
MIAEAPLPRQTECRGHAAYSGDTRCPWPHRRRQLTGSGSSATSEAVVRRISGISQAAAMETCAAYAVHAAWLNPMEQRPTTGLVLEGPLLQSNTWRHALVAGGLMPVPWCHGLLALLGGLLKTALWGPIQCQWWENTLTESLNLWSINCELTGDTFPTFAQQ